MVPSSGKMYFLAMLVKCFLTVGTNSGVSNWVMGNLESIHRRPASVLRTASTLAPDLKEYWRWKAFLGKVWPII